MIVQQPSSLQLKFATACCEQCGVEEEVGMFEEVSCCPMCISEHQSDGMEHCNKLTQKQTVKSVCDDIWSPLSIVNESLFEQIEPSPPSPPGLGVAEFLRLDAAVSCCKGCGAEEEDGMMQSGWCPLCLQRSM
jgi:predicted Zn-ribbon and HTH transcriptional regulator